MNNRSNILSNDTENDYRKWLKEVGLNKENGYDNNQDYQGIDDNARAFYNMNGPVQISHKDLSRYLDYYPWINMEQQQLLKEGGAIKVSTEGYKNDSPDRFAPELMIPSSHITMKGVSHPVIGMDEHGMRVMLPGEDYQFSDSEVHEIPIKQQGGQLNIDSTLNANRKVPFVDRIINSDKYPVRKNPDGTVSTHLMAWASDDNGPFVYPTLRLVNNQWVENPDAEAALKAGDFIRFTNDQQADYFSKHYKEATSSKLLKHQMGGMLLRDREYQAGGQPQPTPKPDSAQLVNKYGRYVDGRTVWLDWAGRKMGDSTIKDMTSQAATTQKLNPAILYASAMEEGLQQRVNHPDIISQSYYDNVGAKGKDYPVDGFNAYGLDTFSDQFNTLVKKGYLKPEFKDKFLPFEGLNEQNKKVNTAAFRDDASALQAKAAMMAYSRDRLSEYAQRKSINLSPEAQNFFTMSAYNLGDTGVQKMMDYFQKQGLLKDNAFLKTAPKLYKQVYDHVMPRIQGANMLQGEHVFQGGGDTPSYYGKPDINLMLQRLQQLKATAPDPRNISQVATDNAQPYLQHGQVLNTLFNHYDQTYNAIYNQGMEEKWPKARLQKALATATTPIQQQIDSVQSLMPQHYKEGGSIHIKPSHRGRFTAWAKKHGMSVSEAAHHVMSNKGNYSSSVVKMANFAKNFAQVGMEVKPTPIQNAQHTNVVANQVQDINEHTQAYLDESQAPKPGINYLPFLNIFNRVLGSVSDSMRSNEQNFQARQQAVFQSQQDSYTPRGRDQYGNPTIYQAGGVIDEDRSYLAPLPQIPSFNEQGPSFSSAPVSTPTGTPTRALRLPAVKSDVNVDDKAEFAFNYYRQRGVDPKVAAGIVGNLAVESNFNPKAKGDNGQATGIAQWHPERWNGLKKWAAQNGSDPFALTTQLEYILHEPGWADKSLHATSDAGSPEAAAYTFGKTFERPNDKFADWGRRMGVAQKIHSKYLPQQQETYKAGGEYEMSDEQITQLEKQGYKLERI